MYSIGNCLRAPMRRLLAFSVFCSHNRYSHLLCASCSATPEVHPTSQLMLYSIPTSTCFGESKSPRSACTATSKRVAPKALTMAPVLVSMRSWPSLLMRNPASRAWEFNSAYTQPVFVFQPVSLWGTGRLISPELDGRGVRHPGLHHVPMHAHPEEGAM